MARLQPKDCPCFSGRRYAACCEPLHDGAPAKSPEALMRSRYAAFALGLGDYLVDTLAADHPDRAAVPREVLARELSRVKDTQRFLGLTIVHAEGDEVLFVARIFERGKDVSFGELSTFVREDGRIRYASGVLVPRARLPEDLGALDRASFLARAEG